MHRTHLPASTYRATVSSFFLIFLTHSIHSFTRRDRYVARTQLVEPVPSLAHNDVVFARRPINARETPYCRASTSIERTRVASHWPFLQSGLPLKVYLSLQQGDQKDRQANREGSFVSLRSERVAFVQKLEQSKDDAKKYVNYLVRTSNTFFQLFSLFFYTTT